MSPFKSWLDVDISSFKIGFVVDILGFFCSAIFWLLFQKIELLFPLITSHTDGTRFMVFMPFTVPKSKFSSTTITNLKISNKLGNNYLMFIVNE